MNRPFSIRRIGTITAAIGLLLGLAVVTMGAGSSDLPKPGFDNQGRTT